MNADAALEGKLPGVVRLAAADAISAADAPTPISPSNDEKVIEEYDPWGPFNRRKFAFNRQLDRFALKLVATVWDGIIPDLAQESIGNFFSNLSMPLRLVNNLFQRNIEGAGRELARLSLNLSMGVLGLFDVATEPGIAKNDKDTGQTLGVYGVGPGPYLVLPLLPPLTVRDGIGFAVDSAMNPLSYVAPSAANTGSRGVNIVNERAGNLERFEGVEAVASTLAARGPARGSPSVARVSSLQ